MLRWSFVKTPIVPARNYIQLSFQWSSWGENLVVFLRHEFFILAGSHLSKNLTTFFSFISVLSLLSLPPHTRVVLKEKLQKLNSKAEQTVGRTELDCVVNCSPSPTTLFFRIITRLIRFQFDHGKSIDFLAVLPRCRRAS